MTGNVYPVLPVVDAVEEDDLHPGHRGPAHSCDNFVTSCSCKYGFGSDFFFSLVVVSIYVDRSYKKKEYQTTFTFSRIFIIKRGS